MQWTSGACFYNTPINLGECSKWTVEFDYRISDGTGADGMAFCFLANPPQGYQNAAGIGIPSDPKGVMVVLDVFNNCGPPTPKLEIRYGDGTQNYSECPNPAEPDYPSLALLSQNSLQPYENYL